LKSGQLLAFGMHKNMFWINLCILSNSTDHWEHYSKSSLRKNYTTECCKKNGKQKIVSHTKHSTLMAFNSVNDNQQQRCTDSEIFDVSLCPHW